MSSFQAAPGVRLLETEDGGLIVNLQTDFYYALNRTGLETWHVLSAGGTIEQAAGGLASAFGVRDERAVALVENFLRDARSASLLVEQRDE